MKQVTKDIKKKYDEWYEKINKVYNFPKPSLHIVHYPSGTSGAFYSQRNKIRINSSNPEWEKTIIHEFCHAVNYACFNPRGDVKLGHNKRFWILCYEFGLTEKDYAYGLTNAMKAAKVEFNKVKHGVCISCGEDKLIAKRGSGRCVKCFLRGESRKEEINAF